MNKAILVIDDKEKLCKSLEMNFQQLGFRYDYALNSPDALRKLDKRLPDIVLLDLSLKEESGLNVLAKIRGLYPKLPVIMITGYGSIETAVIAMKAGASDYVQKPLNFPNLLKIIEHTLKCRESGDGERIITKSKVMEDLLQKAERLARTDFPVLITGDSGTGKERFAHFLHQQSKRSSMELYSINCAAFPENLLDNELFGHEKGAYTGADRQFSGIFERSDGGTLFMDELGDMSLQTQAKILRTLQNQEIRRIGGNENIRIDVRFIGATNKNLKELMCQKRFREDLYYRLSTAVLHIPSLKERPEDILPLAEHFLEPHFTERPLSFSPEAISALLRYPWPGNIRELRNAVHYAGALATGDEIAATDLPQGIYDRDAIPSSFSSLEEQERTLILQTLSTAGNNKKRAAEMLNISRKTLYNKLDKFGINHDG